MVQDARAADVVELSQAKRLELEERTLEKANVIGKAEPFGAPARDGARRFGEIEINNLERQFCRAKLMGDVGRRIAGSSAGDEDANKLARCEPPAEYILVNLLQSVAQGFFERRTSFPLSRIMIGLAHSPDPL